MTLVAVEDDEAIASLTLHETEPKIDRPIDPISERYSGSKPGTDTLEWVLHLFERLRHKRAVSAFRSI